MKRESGDSAVTKFVVKSHLSFMGILGFVAAVAEFSKPFERAKEYALTHDGALPICYGAWIALYGVKSFITWRLKCDLAEVRRDNRRKGRGR